MNHIIKHFFALLFMFQPIYLLTRFWAITYTGTPIAFQSRWLFAYRAKQGSFQWKFKDLFNVTWMTRLRKHVIFNTPCDRCSIRFKRTFYHLISKKGCVTFIILIHTVNESKNGIKVPYLLRYYAHKPTNGEEGE